MATQTTSTILNSAIAVSQQLLTEYALGEDLIDDLTTAFGSSYNGDAAAELIEQWQAGEFGSFPTFEIRSADEINGANGAFSADTNKIYISEEYLLANANNLDAISNLVLEEFGHFVDAQINTVDSAGDEGDIFSRLVRGESFTNGELQQLKLENDKTIVNIDGQEITIEQQESIDTLPEDFKIRGDLTNLHVGDFNGDGHDDFLRQEKGAFDDDNIKTAQVFLADSSGNFSPDRRTTLPESFLIKGDLTNLHVGDFNGDGRDDFLRQEKGDADNDNRNTARIFFADENGNFSLSHTIALPENLKIKGDLTNLHIGDFNGDGHDDFLRQEKGRFDNDNRNTAQIFLADSDGSFSTTRRTTLPENFSIKGDLTNLHVGDFNGDGLDDFISVNKSDFKQNIFLSVRGEDQQSRPEFRKERAFGITGGLSTVTNLIIEDVGDFNGDGFDDLLIQETNKFLVTKKVSSIVLSNGDRTFSKAPLPESLKAEVGKTNLKFGDFDNDGFLDILRQDTGLSNENTGFFGFPPQEPTPTAQIFSNLNFPLQFGIGFDKASGSVKNDTLLGGIGNDSLDGRDGNDSLNGEDGDDSLNGGDGNDSLNGGRGNDTLRGGKNKDLLIGGDGDDFLDGGKDRNTLEGGNGDDSLRGGNVQDILNGGNGNDSLEGGNGDDILNGGDGQDTLKGGDRSDRLNGDAGDDFLNGDEGDDFLNGDEGDDTLEGGVGNDFLDGGEGVDIASYSGGLDGFEITFNEDLTITIKDTDDTNGDEGTDTLQNISQLSFDNARFSGNSQINTVLGIAGVSSDPNGASSIISGGKADATNFIIDFEGTAGPILDFNTQKLATFINDITLPDPDIELARLISNLGFDAIGGLVGSVPGIGSVFAGGIAMTQTLANFQFDLAQITAQRQAAIDAVNEFDRLDFGTIVENTREIIEVKDFQIGVDNLLLPSVQEGTNVGFIIQKGGFNGSNGVFIEAIIGSETSKLVFIANQYDSLNDDQFEAQISNLLSSQEGPGTILSTLNQTPQLAEVDPFGAVNVSGSFAGDHIFGEALTSSSEREGAGDYSIEGAFGDDLLQGNIGNDFLHGGFIGDGGLLFRDDETGERSLKDGEIEYQDDGFDILQGGLGDDELFGGSGNDILDGGGFNNTIDALTGIAGVLINDGTDTLTGGGGNDTFVFNTLLTGTDIIKDFTILDQIRIDGNRFGEDAGKDEVTIEDFKFINGSLTFNSQEFATVENFNELNDANLAFSQNLDTGIITFGLAN